MLRFTLALFLVTAIPVLCLRAQEKNAPPPDGWKLRLSAIDGLNISGSGSVEVSSDGTVRTKGAGKKPQESKLTAAQLKALDTIVRESPSGQWPLATPRLNADAVLYDLQLTVTKDGKTVDKLVSFDGTSVGKLKPDASEMVRALAPLLP